MADELQAVKDIVAHPVTGGGLVAAVVGWLANKVWRGHRHEIAGMKNATTLNSAALAKLDEELKAHALLDQELFREIKDQMARNHTELLEHLINLKE